MPTLVGLTQPVGGSLAQLSITEINKIVSDQNTNNTTLAAGTLTGGNTISAHSGGGQGSATALTAGINRLSTVAAVADSVALPASAAGLFVTVINDATNSAQVFGAGTDTINGVATATGVVLPGKSAATYFCPAAGIWFSVASNNLGIQAISASGAIAPHVGATYVITKSAAAAVMTLAAPTATVDDGLIITITSSTAQAHTVTATGLFADGAGHVNLATFGGSAGASMQIMAFNAKWLVLYVQNVTMS